jgi:hypothetical protein
VECLTLANAWERCQGGEGKAGRPPSPIWGGAGMRPRGTACARVQPPAAATARASHTGAASSAAGAPPARGCARTAHHRGFVVDSTVWSNQSPSTESLKPPTGHGAARRRAAGPGGRPRRRGRLPRRAHRERGFFGPGPLWRKLPLRPGAGSCLLVQPGSASRSGATGQFRAASVTPAAIAACCPPGTPPSNPQTANPYSPWARCTTC